ncbi:hypothetical protein [Sphingopyxis sp. R3-92]|uniref:hypothetical protein n=1 Tax=Sphingopyxis sp. R3-92 TaxID=3158553 RepID=UPI003EE7E9EE
MRKNPKLLILIGALLLAAGFVLDLGAGGEAQATPQQEQACRTEMTGRGAEAAALAEKCSEANFAIATIASSAGSGMSAQDAAAMISQNNQAEVGGSTLSKFLMGLGIGLFIAGVIGLVVRKNKG